MKTFFASLMPIWPDGWISIKALTNASKSVFERITSKINTNGHGAPSASEVVNTGGPSKRVATPPSSLTLTPPKLAPPVSTTYLSPTVRSPPSIPAAVRAATTAQSGVTVEFSSTKPITTSSPYVLQFASPSTSTASKKETPRVTVPPIIDLTEMSSTNVSSNSAKQQQLTSPASAAPASSTVNFSPPSITTTSKSGTPTPANSACPQRRIVLNASPSTNSAVSSPTILNRAQMSSVTVPVAQFLGRGTSSSPIAATVPPQQQQQASTLQTVTNIISAYQANFQKQQAQAQVMANMQKQAQAMVNLQKQQAQASVTKRQEKQPSIIQTQANIQKSQQRVQQTPRQQPQQQQRVTTFPENVRYTAPVSSIIINRSQQQHPQAAHATQINSATVGQQASIGASGNTRIAHSTPGVVSTPHRGVWGSQISSSSSSGTSQLTASLPTAQIIRTQSTQQQQQQQRMPSQQQQQLMQAHSQQSQNQVQLQQFQQQQQFRAAVAGMVARSPLDYLSWTRQFDTSQNQSNEAHRNSDRNSGK
ncbi:unnamed protein product [Hymenolepis diminuta]|nr:unnamed protein product [Hymenolepis diminuta]